MKCNKFPLLFGLLVLTSTIIGCAQKEPVDGEKIRQLTLFENARENKDILTAIVALNAYLLDDTVAGPYHDTLATMYFMTGNFASGVAVGEKVLAKNPDNLQLMELMSEGYQKTNNYPKAIELMNKLFSRSNDYRYKYQVATLQFEDQQIDPCLKTIEDILKNGIDSNATIEMAPGGLSDIVPIEAACYNLLAMIEDQVNNDSKTSLKYFAKALEIYPDFKFPKAYIREKQYRQYLNPQ